MAAVMSPQSSSTSPPSRTAPSSASIASLPPLITSPTPRLQRAPSYASKRLSTFSNTSQTNARSRPSSIAYPLFHSSLPYTLVRDFAYGPIHPLFYGPLPENPSELSTPASDVNRRLSDPPAGWEGARGGWSAAAWEPGEQLPRKSFDDGRDGPPWSEDEDIHSPIVTSTRHHKKHKSNVVEYDRMGNRYQDLIRRVSHSTNGDGSRMYYVSEMDDSASGPGSEYITYPPSSTHLTVPSGSPRRDSHYTNTLPNRSYGHHQPHSHAHHNHHTDASPDTPQARNHSEDTEMSSPTDDYDDSDPHSHHSNNNHYFFDDEDEDEDSRLSRSYEFTIADPAEEFHGKAVALFDFARENDNELPLVEGQVILVSYRHGQGWLVAQDPTTGESGLVPEEYVRLLRDIEGGWKGWVDGGGAAGILGTGLGPAPGAGPGAAFAGNGTEEGVGLGVAAHGSDPMDVARTPTQAEHGDSSGGGGGGGGGSGTYYTPVVSTFSTSSKDFQQPMQIDKTEGKRGEKSAATASSEGR